MRKIFFFFYVYLYVLAAEAALVEWVVSKKERYLTQPLNEEDIHKGFPHLVRYYLAQLGHEVVEKTVKESGKGDFVIWQGIGNKRKFKRIFLFKKKGIQQALINFEPPLYERFALNSSILHLFDRVFTWNTSIPKNKRIIPFYYPVRHLMEEKLPSFEDRTLSAMVLSNHVSQKANELYSKRRELVSFYEALPEGEKSFHLYGRKWEKKLKTYLGTPEDAIETLKGYRFAYVLENWANDVGYITEKIFCAFAAGAVPIYWGASNLDAYVPRDCFIDGSQFASFQEIHEHLLSITQEEWLGYVERIRAYLVSEKGALFSKESVAYSIATEIAKSLEGFDR